MREHLDLYASLGALVLSLVTLLWAQSPHPSGGLPLTLAHGAQSVTLDAGGISVGGRMARASFGRAGLHVVGDGLVSAAIFDEVRATSGRLGSKVGFMGGVFLHNDVKSNVLLGGRVDRPVLSIHRPAEEAP